MNVQNFIMMPIPAESFKAVCALLGGVALAAVAAAPGKPAEPVSQDTDGVSEQSGSGDVGEQSSTSTTAPTGASPSDTEIDAGGHPWSAELHASTKGKTKDGYWRMKVGVSRPDPLPGYPVDGATGTSEVGAASEAGASATTGTAGSSDGDDDEFAAFRAAAAESDATDAAAAVPARVLSDADLGALCNQAAVKLGDPSPVKEIIAQYVPQGEVAHSRNIPADKREEFAKAVETKAGIEFAG